MHRDTVCVTDCAFPLPNTEVVTLLILLCTRWFQKKALFIIDVFLLLEGVF